jgi:hypothetical protein
LRWPRFTGFIAFSSSGRWFDGGQLDITQITGATRTFAIITQQFEAIFKQNIGAKIKLAPRKLKSAVFFSRFVGAIVKLAPTNFVFHVA